MSRHLDLGCGKFPRNPYNQTSVHGVDIIDSIDSEEVIYNKCNIAVETLPFEDSYFDSVSAYDFLEHIPRVHLENGESTLPFIHAMNEIYRVLKPGGRFLALTPAYPKESAFVDPTHINVITKNTHKYFTEPDNWGQMYGFAGKFEIVRVGWRNFDSEIRKSTPIKRIIKKILFIVFPRFVQHFLWEFKAIKK